MMKMFLFVRSGPESSATVPSSEPRRLLARAAEAESLSDEWRLRKRFSALTRARSAACAAFLRVVTSAPWPAWSVVIFEGLTSLGRDFSSQYGMVIGSSRRARRARCV